MDWLYVGSTWVLPVVIAITFHEAAHGFVAWRLGDDTAKNRGRVSFNPLRHIDPFGTVILPAMLFLFRAPFLFGYAKPVPVNFHNLNHPKRDMIWVAAAGPAINLILAQICAVALYQLVFLDFPFVPWIVENLKNAIVINLILAIFNLIPLPPLDGGRIAVGLLPMRLALPLARLERFGMLILIALLFIVPLLGAQFGLAVNPLRWVIGPPLEFLYDVIMTVAGFRPEAL